MSGLATTSQKTVPEIGGLAECPGGVSPQHKDGAAADRVSIFRTLLTCHCPPRAVRTPRLLRAMAMPRRLVMPKSEHGDHVRHMISDRVDRHVNIDAVVPVTRLVLA
jgi:hypothetical protein